jgi:aryl-alcohol dehydrogenase-like predicted oxidoreductase
MQHLIFGTAGLTGLPSLGSALRLLREAEDLGIRHFDTAPLYGRGYAEAILGIHLRKTGSRSSVTTKFGLGACPAPRIHPFFAMPLNHLRRSLKGRPSVETPSDENHTPTPYRRITRAAISATLSQSMARLGRDHIEYFFLHEGLPSFIEPDGMEYLLDLKGKGIVGSLGIASNAHDIISANPESFRGFDILQYESGESLETLRSIHPDKKHFIHGCFRGRDARREGTSMQDPLSEWVGRNPEGKVVFFTRRIQVLRSNLLAYNKDVIR